VFLLAAAPAVKEQNGGMALAFAVGQHQRAFDFTPSPCRDADDGIHRTLSIVV
jgi:hypothetical protein